MDLRDSIKKYIYLLPLGIVLGLLVVFVYNSINLSYFLMSLLIILTCIPILQRIINRSFDFFEPLILFSFLTLFLYVFVPLVLVSIGDINVDDYFNYSMFLVIISVCSFFVGYHYACLFKNLLFRKSPPSSHTYNDRIRQYLIVIILLIVSVFFYLILMNSIGGVKFYIQNMMYARNALREGQGYFVMLSQFLMLVTFLTAYSFRDRLNKIFLFILIMITGFVTLSFGAVGDGLMFLFIILAFDYYERYKRKKVAVFRLILSLFIMASLIVLVRYYRETTELSTFYTVMSSGVSYWFIKYFDTFPMLVKVIENVPDNIPFQWGGTISFFLQFFLPRTLFPEKTNGIGEFLTRELFPEVHQVKVTFAFPLIAEGYVNFGLMGVIVESLVLGVCYRLLYIYIHKSKFSAYSLAIYAVSLFYLYPFVRAGLFDFPMVTYLFIILSYSVIMKILRMKLFEKEYIPAISQRNR